MPDTEEGSTARPTISVAGKPHRVSAGHLLRLPAGQPHAVKAVGRFKMVLIMMRA